MGESSVEQLPQWGYDLDKLTRSYFDGHIEREVFVEKAVGLVVANTNKDRSGATEMVNRILDGYLARLKGEAEPREVMPRDRIQEIKDRRVRAMLDAKSGHGAYEKMVLEEILISHDIPWLVRVAEAALHATAQVSAPVGEHEQYTIPAERWHALSDALNQEKEEV